MASPMFSVVCFFFLTAGLIHFIGFLPPSVSRWYKHVARILLSAIIAHNALPVLKRIFERKISPEGKAVIITGCDSGFGHRLAKRLDRIGFQVFAGCLFPSGDGAQWLKESSSSRLHVFGLDVTKDESVDKALKYVKDNLGNAKLWAVVNNAGVVKGLEVAYTPLKYYSESLGVNALGVVRVTKAFLPLLMKSKGRVITVTSAAGRCAFPGLSAYTMSKFAAVGFCESVRYDLQPWGVDVISVEPEAFKTNMTNSAAPEKLFEELLSGIDEYTYQLYGKQYFDAFKADMERYCDFASDKVHKVIDDLEHAVTAVEPASVYRPRRNLLARFAFWALQHFPSNVLYIAHCSRRYLMDFPVPDGLENVL